METVDAFSQIFCTFSQDLLSTWIYKLLKLFLLKQVSQTQPIIRQTKSLQKTLISEFVGA